MSTKISAGVDFIAMIPIDCKITKFSLHLFVYFFSNNYNIYLTHKHHFKKKNDHKYYFRGYHTH